jgi:hypothetical protein
VKSILLAALILLATASNGLAQDIRWPRQLTNEGSVLNMYLPQVDKWENYKALEFRSAFSLKPAQGKEVVGVLYMKAATDVDMETHMAVTGDLSISKTNFPSLDAEQAEKMGNIVRSFLSPERTLDISVEQIVACAPKDDSVATVTMKMIHRAYRSPGRGFSQTPERAARVEGVRRGFV